MNILFFGGHYWDRGAWFRKQQFALRFSQKGHKVFYIEDSPSIIRKRKKDKNLLFKTFYKKINHNLYIVTPSAIFPYPKNYYTRHAYNIKLFIDLHKIFKKENVNDYVLWTNKVELSTIFDRINKIKIIDICDDLPYYEKLAGNEKGFKSVMKFFREAFDKADIPIVSALKIKEKYNSLTNKEILLIPNGHNFSLNRSKDLEVPEELKKIPSPRIGFLGSLFQFIDVELIEFLIKERPNYNFIFVGDIESEFPIEKINHYKNVFILGKKDKKLIPNYLNGFDICINPFKVHEVNDSVNPVKVFEYLAMNKQVVSTYMYSLMQEDISNCINFARSYVEFITILDSLIKKNNLINHIPKDLMAKYSWNSLFQEMITKIKEKYNLEF